MDLDPLNRYFGTISPKGKKNVAVLFAEMMILEIPVRLPQGTMKMK
jgi:hypothetical protein